MFLVKYIKNIILMSKLYIYKSEYNSQWNNWILKVLKDNLS